MRAPSSPSEPTTPPATLADRLRHAIGDRSAAEVAVQAGITRQHVHRLITGRMKRGPSIEVVQSLADALGVTPAWLGFGEVAGE